METTDLLAQVDVLRTQATAALDQAKRAERGQVMTPAPVATLMASMFSSACNEVRLLDPGAGIGSLTAATVAELLGRFERPTRIEVVAYELEPVLAEYLHRVLELCEQACAAAGVAFSAHYEVSDFLEVAAEHSLKSRAPRFNLAILNPPYRKLRSESRERALCRVMGLEVSNLYAAFVGATVHLIEDGAELVAITPRSFANGPYFRAFRNFLLDRVALRRLHAFDARNRAFREDAVLQENLILHAVRSSEQPEAVEITANEEPGSPMRQRRVPCARVVYEHDRERFIHLIDSDEADAVAATIAGLDNYLDDLGLSVSTGPVVDFRALDFVRESPSEGSAPLLYPTHLRDGRIEWPRDAAKYNALVLTDESTVLTVPRGDYVLVKRFTAKEERRRVVASVLQAADLQTERVGLENHLNFFHMRGSGLPLALARGLALYLNSTVVDSYFRQFSGHTQVNAADLRNMPYPSRERLEAAGREFAPEGRSQTEIDQAVERYLLA